MTRRSRLPARGAARQPPPTHPAGAVGARLQVALIGDAWRILAELASAERWRGVEIAYVSRTDMPSAWAAAWRRAWRCRAARLGLLGWLGAAGCGRGGGVLSWLTLGWRELSPARLGVT